MHVKLASHSARGRYVVKAASQCVCAYLDRGLAMCFLKPSSLPQCVFAIRLRLPNVSSQCVCATQCVFTMRLRHPMRLHNASAPANASSPNGVFRMRLAPANASGAYWAFLLTNASSQCGCVFRSFTTLPQRRRNLYIYICTFIKRYIYICCQHVSIMVVR